MTNSNGIHAPRKAVYRPVDPPKCPECGEKMAQDEKPDEYGDDSTNSSFYMIEHTFKCTNEKCEVSIVRVQYIRPEDTPPDWERRYQRLDGSFIK